MLISDRSLPDHQLLPSKGTKGQVLFSELSFSSRKITKLSDHHDTLDVVCLMFLQKAAQGSNEEGSPEVSLRPPIGFCLFER